MLEALLAHLDRTPEEHVAYWAFRQREEYERWWVLEDSLATLERFDADAVAEARAEQRQVHGEQAERARIRDRYADEQENR